MARPGNVWMECPTEEDSTFVKAQTFSGHLHAQIVRVETISTERTGKSYQRPQELQTSHVQNGSTSDCACKGCLLCPQCYGSSQSHMLAPTQQH